jgi:ABC-type transporter lipoprotein component MlaA
MDDRTIDRLLVHSVTQHSKMWTHVTPCDIESMVSVFVHASYIVASVFNALLYLMLNTQINRILNEINVG